MTENVDNNSGLLDRQSSRREWIWRTAQAVAIGTGATMVWKAADNVMKSKRPYWYEGLYDDVVINPPDGEGRHPFAESTLETFADFNKKLFSDNGRAVENVNIVQTIADNIANGVAHSAHEEVSKLEGMDGISMPEMFAYLASTQQGQEYYIRVIAMHLIRANTWYKETASLNQGVINLAGADRMEIDCDLLTHVAMHCASRHNMPFVPFRAPGHMYLGSVDHNDLAFEMTAFRDRKTNSIGDGLITTHSSKRDWGIFDKWSDHPEALKKFGYFCPASGEDLAASIVNAVIHGRLEFAAAWADYDRYGKMAEMFADQVQFYDCPGGIMLQRSAHYACENMRKIRIKQGRNEEAAHFAEIADRYSAIAKEHQDLVEHVEGVTISFPAIR